MGQKVHPKCFRLASNKNWSSIVCCDKKSYKYILSQDLSIRSFVMNLLDRFSVISVVIFRTGNTLVVVISLVKTGFISKHRDYLDKIKNHIANISGLNAEIDLKEFRKPDLSAAIVAKSIATQLEKRMSHKRAMKKALNNAKSAGAVGMKIVVSGRPGGCEIARSDRYLEGRMPSHTIQANIDYAFYPAKTLYGVVGVKVWILV